MKQKDWLKVWKIESNNTNVESLEHFFTSSSSRSYLPSGCLLHNFSHSARIKELQKITPPLWA